MSEAAALFYLSLTACRETRGDGERNDKGILNGRNVSFRSVSTTTDAWDTFSDKWNWNKKSWNSGLAKKMKQWNELQVTNSLMNNLLTILSFIILKNSWSQVSRAILLLTLNLAKSALLIVFWLYSKANSNQQRYENCLLKLDLQTI